MAPFGPVKIWPTLDRRAIVRCLPVVGVMIVFAGSTFASSAATNEQLNSRLCLAVQDGNVSEAKKLLEKGADSNSEIQGLAKHPVLMEAVIQGKAEIAKALIAHGADVNRESDMLGILMTPLGVAAQNGDMNLVTMLLESKGDPNKGALVARPIVVAVENDNLEMMKLLLKGGASISLKLDYEGTNNVSLLLVSISRHAYKVMDDLISRGMDLNEVDGFGGHSLNWAAFFNADPEILKRLIDKGAKVNVRGFQSKTALDHAIGKGHDESAKLLKKMGALTGKEMK
jgi:ankyrin repeat protein